nr:MAG TPA_asm: hypothetical protein [Caudoviricetes sp.]
MIKNSLLQVGMNCCIILNVMLTQSRFLNGRKQQ